MDSGDENIMSVLPEAGDNEETIRPQALDDYVGQEELKNNLRIFIQA
ncbi:MAG TPA: Holliday junction branch migration DNA helicase RuvB, partial [Erysipelotrichaceae bacterium]|nr:Holliday junction branch migration DNA helicase RuvB [Erysipelotrichaceae bacterium]